MMSKKYLLWNNKGGVGKTFLSYNLSVEYALAHSEEDIVVIDACPQTNISEMILGGNGTGAELVSEFNNRNFTIAGYIKQRYSSSPHARLGHEANLFVSANQFNTKMPENLYLLCGDMDLDICSRLINHIAISPVKKSWEHSRLFIDDLIQSFENARQLSGRRQVFFIDCNPSFANYTENAILAANRIIIPCTADAASIRGIKNLFNLMYNIAIDQQKLSDEYIDFYQDVQRHHLNLPKIHLFVQNRSRSLSKDATRAFRSHADEISRLVADIYQEHRDCFTDEPISERVMNVKDGNTLAAILNHEGCALSDLRHQRYAIYGQETQANNDQIIALKNDINALLSVI